MSDKEDIAVKAFMAAEEMTNKLAQDIGPLETEDAQRLAQINSFIESLSKMVAQVKKVPIGQSLKIQVGRGDKKIVLSWMRSFLHDIQEPELINRFRFVESTQKDLRTGGGFKTYSAKAPTRKSKKRSTGKSTWKGKKPDPGKGESNSKPKRSSKDSSGSGADYGE